MSSKYDYPQVSVTGEATNEEAAVQLVSGTVGMFLFIEKLHIAVYEAAVGGGGKCRIQDTLGNIIYTINADTAKEVPLDFGEEGYKVSAGEDVQVIVYGGLTTQASVSVFAKGHLSFQDIRTSS